MGKKFIGLQYPIVQSSHGLFAQQNGVEQIKADLLQLLLTNPGERVMMPTYGTPLRDLLFDQNDPSLATRAKQVISNAILAWEPRIVVQDITVSNGAPMSALNPSDTGAEAQSILFITIQFVDPQNISAVQQLSLAVPIGD